MLCHPCLPLGPSPLAGKHINLVCCSVLKMSLGACSREAGQTLLVEQECLCLRSSFRFLVAAPASSFLLLFIFIFCDVGSFVFISGYLSLSFLVCLLSLLVGNSVLIFPRDLFNGLRFCIFLYY